MQKSMTVDPTISPPDVLVQICAARKCWWCAVRCSSTVAAGA